MAALSASFGGYKSQGKFADFSIDCFDIANHIGITEKEEIEFRNRKEFQKT